jgi:coenzyme F420-reducing hydrogenase alpha subunit
MHDVPDIDININNLSKIEGHANLEVNVRRGKVDAVKLKISEAKRFFTQSVRGKPALSVPQLVSRICGTCSIAHLTCCIEAVEDAMGIKPSEQTVELRHLTMDALMIRDHAMHLYIFCLPDIFGVDSVLELAKKERGLLEDALLVKKAGNELGKLVAGRSVHAPFPAVGGFTKVPSNEGAKELLHELEHAREHAIGFVDLFHDNMQEFERETHFIALKNEKYDFLGGEICSSEGYCITRGNFRNHLTSVVMPYSQSTGFEFAGKEYMVGALARMNLNKEALHPNTKRDCAGCIGLFPSHNVMMNNLAQAIEIVHCMDRAMDRLEGAEFKPEKYTVPPVKAGKGIGVIEAPRGTLYYDLETDEKGLIKYINLVIPTAQNHVNIERDIAVLVERELEQMDKDEISMEIEKLIRAYDPCMSCATHFLKVKWKGEAPARPSRKRKR